jgi:uncharacterized phage infection (PIP) family protein YhgE
MTWYDEKTHEMLSVFSSEVGKRVSKIKEAARDIKRVLDEINELKSGEKEDVLKVALERFIDKISSTVDGISFPDTFTYSSVGGFLDRLKRSVMEIFEAGRRWIPRFRGRRYKSVVSELDKHFLDLTAETQSLDSVYKSYGHLDMVERVRDGIQGLNEMVARVPVLKSQVKDEQERLEAAQESVKECEIRVKEYKKLTGAAEKENIDAELEKIRQTLVSQMDLLRKSMSKLRELVEAGTLHVRPEFISTIDLYSRDLLEALNAEADGCPAFKDLLIEMKKVLGDLGLEGSRERRTAKRIDSLLSGDLIASSQKRVKELMQKRQDVSKEFKPSEEKKVLSDLEESRKLLRDEETRMHRLNGELDETTSKLRKSTKEISSEIAKLTGEKVHILLAD